MVVEPPVPLPVALLAISMSIVVALGTSLTSNKVSSKSASVNPVDKAVTPLTLSNKIISPTSAP